MIVLDTHAWFWWAGIPGKLSPVARNVIDSSAVIGISAVSCWELALLAERARIRLDKDTPLWIDDALADRRVVSLPLTSEIAVQAALLERVGFHGDPADRMIYATARANGAPLVTRDSRLRIFDPAGTVW